MEQMFKIVINLLDLRVCYSSGIIKPLSIFNELCLNDQEITFYKKGDQSHATIAESSIVQPFSFL